MIEEKFYRICRHCGSTWTGYSHSSNRFINETGSLPLCGWSKHEWLDVPEAWFNQKNFAFTQGSTWDPATIQSMNDDKQSGK